LQLPNPSSRCSAFAVFIVASLILRLSVYAQTPTLSAPSQNHDRTIITGDPILPTDAEFYDSLRQIDVPAELMKKEGANTPIEALRQVPFFVGTTATENDSNGGDGTAFINFYALGSNNVLTLINGRRAFSFSDINAIPLSALARVEVLDTGIYGSDSAGGTVNFIMLNAPGEKPYEGAELYALYGNTTDADAHVRQVYLRGGVTGLDGKVSIAAAGEYYSRANLYSRDREISRTADLSNDPTGLGLGGFNNNSPTYAGRVSVNAGASSFYGMPLGQLVLRDLSNNQVTPGSYRRFEPPVPIGPNEFPAGTDPSRFNFRAFTPAIPAVEKAMYYVTGRYKILGENVQLYGDIMYTKAKQDNGRAGLAFAITSLNPSGIGSGLVETRASQFNPFGNDLTSVRYRFQQELGNLRSFFDKDFYRYTVGINGDLNFKDNGFLSRFGYDSGFVYERFDELRIDSGGARPSLIRQAIAGTLVPGVFFDPFIGINAPPIGFAPTYTINAQGHGVPTGMTALYNNVATAQAASYSGHSEFYERDWLGDARIYAHLFPNLWNGGIDFLLGYEHRESSQHTPPDSVQTSGDQLGFTASPNTKYKHEVDSFFGQMVIPIVRPTMQISGVRSLDIVGAFHLEKFEDTNQYTHATATFDSDGSPEVGLRYQPFADLMLRGSWRRAIRAPIFEELFAPLVQDFPVIFGTGIGVILQPPEGVWESGNTALSPETTDSYSVGIVWTPKFVPGFVMTVDVYQMFTTDLIIDPATFAQVLLTDNIIAPFHSPTGSDCGRLNDIGIIRDLDGNLECVNSAFGNAGKRNVQGINITATYEIPIERFGKFTLSGGWNHFFTWKAQSGPGLPFNSFLGNYNNGTLPLAPGAIPWNKGFLRGEWEWRHFDFVATGNYTGDFIDDPAFSSDQFFVGGPDFTDRRRRVPSYITLDMQLSYEWVRPATEAPPTYAKEAKESKSVMQTVAGYSSVWQRILWGTKLTVGVNDAFDRQPPTVLGALNDNYDTSLYSIRNRFWYVSLDKKF
jgi:iron complex outermembrane receptor protein